MYLLDRMEEVLQNSSKVPLTNRVLVDETEFHEIIDQLRVAVPEEIQAARRLNRERDAILADARAQADRILDDADAELASRVNEHSLARAAQARAAAIEDDAWRQADEVRREADAYAYRTLQKLRAQIDRIAGAVDQGLEQLSPEEADRR